MRGVSVPCGDSVPPVGPTVLVTGGTGFVGRRVVPRLAAAGWRVWLLSRRTPPDLPAGVSVCEVDLFDQPRVRQVVAEIAASPSGLGATQPRTSGLHALHLAWEATPGVFWKSPANLEWLASSVNLLRAFADAGGSRFVGVGTCAEYAWNHADGLCHETLTPRTPATLYGRCKLAFAEVAETFCRDRGLSFAWGRVFAPYGPGEPPQKLVGAILNDLLAGRPTRCSDGTQWRDYLHVDDLAAALEKLLGSPLAGALNLASGEPVRLADLVRLAGEVCGRTDLVRLGDLTAPPGDPPRLLADVRRLREELGWRPAIPLDEGLRQSAAWWRHHLAPRPG